MGNTPGRGVGVVVLSVAGRAIGGIHATRGARMLEPALGGGACGGPGRPQREGGKTCLDVSAWGLKSTPSTPFHTLSTPSTTWGVEPPSNHIHHTPPFPGGGVWRVWWWLGVGVVEPTGGVKSKQGVDGGVEDMARERDIERLLTRTVEQAGGLCWKFTSPGRVGVPDRFVVGPNGQVLLVELKRPGGRLTRSQRHVHAKLRARGVRVEVVDSTECARIAPAIWFEG